MSQSPGEADKQIGQRIRAYRLYRGFSQEKLADSIGVTFQQLQKYENGTNRVSASRLLHIAEILDAPLSALAPGSSEKGSGFAGLEAHLSATRRSQADESFQPSRKPCCSKIAS
jgi:transcriptional regulator with XRE-family HTH domain